MDYNTVRKTFDYNPDTGDLIWKIRSGNKIRVGGCSWES